MAVFKPSEIDKSVGIGEAIASVVAQADDSMPIVDEGPSSMTLLLLRQPEMLDSEYDDLFEMSIVSLNLAGLKVEWSVRLPESAPPDGGAIDIACRFATMSTQCKPAKSRKSTAANAIVKQLP